MLNSSAEIMINSKVEQPYNLKSLVKLKKSQKESFEMLKEVFDENAVSPASVFECHIKFSEGRE